MCKYKDFMACKLLSFQGSRNPVEVIDWIYKMYLAFITPRCTDKLQTIFNMKKFKVTKICWWNTLGKTMSPDDLLQLTWAEFMVYFKRKFFSTQNMLELENQFFMLKKGFMSIDEYTNAFSDKMEFYLCIVPEEL